MLCEFPLCLNCHFVWIATICGLSMCGLPLCVNCLCVWIAILFELPLCVVCYCVWIAILCGLPFVWIATACGLPFGVNCRFVCIAILNELPLSVDCHWVWIVFLWGLPFCVKRQCVYCHYVWIVTMCGLPLCSHSKPTWKSWQCKQNVSATFPRASQCKSSVYKLLQTLFNLPGAKFRTSINISQCQIQPH